MGERIQMIPATKKQINAINAELHRQGLMNRKSQLVDFYTKGRTDHSPEMSISEAREMLSELYKTTNDMNVSSKLMKKLFAMAIEMGWCPLETKADKNGKLTQQRNYTRVHEWVLKFGFGKKPLREYTYNELPKLVSVFETKIYNEYIVNQSNNKNEK